MSENKPHKGHSTIPCFGEHARQVAQFINGRIENEMLEHEIDQAEQIFAVVKDGEVSAAYAFIRPRRTQDGEVIDLHFVGVVAESAKRPLNRKALHVMFDYPFKVVKAKRVTSYIDSDNEPSLKFTAKVGFVKEGLMRDASCSKENSGVHIFGMTSKDWRIKQQHLWGYRK